ncbi:hypothetical protein llg_40750 [Luteolibacter sp. LG18]|nr:hypothetical protein llg_40750 [Luteolibacter sp. LG18]
MISSGSEANLLELGKSPSRPMKKPLHTLIRIAALLVAAHALSSCILVKPEPDLSIDGMLGTR